MIIINKKKNPKDCFNFNWNHIHVDKSYKLFSKEKTNIITIQLTENIGCRK